jgi:flagellar basal-body rod protein FlgB
MDTTVEVLKKLLDVSAVRHEALAHNLANATTPGYRRQDVAFRDALTQAIGKNDAMAVARVKPQIITDRNAPVDGQGNSVALHREMGALNENSLLYGLSAKILARKYATMRAAINGRR